MANITITMLVQPTRPTVASGKTRTATGRIVLSKNSKWPSSGIEQYFNRCYGIMLNFEPPHVVNWHMSATHKAGQLELLHISAAGSTTSAFGRYLTAASPASGYFTATGI